MEREITQMTKALIILTYDEIEGSSALLGSLPLNSFDEVLVVDGGSTDGTVKFYLDNGIRVTGQKKRGRGEAFRVGAANTKSDILVYFSPDGNEDPADILKLTDCIENGADMQIPAHLCGAYMIIIFPCSPSYTEKNRIWKLHATTILP